MADYSKLTKDELVAEVTKRRNSGSDVSVNIRGNKEELIAALEFDDVENGTGGDDSGLTGDMDNQVAREPDMPTLATQPSNGVFAKGSKYVNKSDGYTYQAVRIKDDDVRPWKARVPAQKSGHTGFYWEGSDAEFKDTFDKP